MERIDTHCHIVPPKWRKHCEDHGFAQPDGMPTIPAWSPEDHLALMDKLQISKSIVSITSPGTYLQSNNHELAREITRETNEELHQICLQHPSRFGFFASLPLPDVEGSIAEIDHALDHLGASGFALMTNSFGIYLGDNAFDAVFEKLNERKAVVFMHPTTCCAGNIDSPKPLNQYPSPMLEFFFDSARAVTNLLLSGTVQRNPDITFLVSHGGGVIPPLLERFTNFSAIINAPASLTSSQAKELFKTRFYFDLAGFPFPDQIHGYLRISDASRLLYGSDYPYTPGSVIERQGEEMDKGLRELFDEDMVRNIYSEHARTLLGL
ncbi:amidohydrolase 2 [Thozetella sp. PMI_491]|nr:amidohydrolase 2 [Thozetella sp. PMI_491]